LPKDDPTRRRPDISIAQNKLQWNPEVSFEEGLKKTIAYFSETL
jgi:UDP-glucuronate decarboxylase